MDPTSRPFEPQRELGRGASSEVWLARLTAPTAGRPVGLEVAAKLAPEAAPPAVHAAFARELEVAARVSHRALVPVLGGGRDAAGSWLLQRYLPGGPLLPHIGARPLEEREALRHLARIADALDTLHAAGWLHGDVKLDNLRLDARGEAFLLDLGLATPINAARAGGGSPAWMSPEELRGAPRDAASEAFALGLVLYTLTTGEHPFLDLHESAPGGIDGLAARVQRHRALRPAVRVPSLSPLVDELCARLLDPDPRERPTPAELVRWIADGELPRALRPAADAPDPWSAPDALPRVGRDAELARLEGHWARVQQTRRARAVTLRGPSGSGRSRLSEELVLRVRRGDRPPTVLVGRASSFLEERPAGPWLQLLRRWLGLPQGTLPDAAALSQLAGLVPPETARGLLATLDPQGIPEAQTSALLAEWLRALSERGPLLVRLEDAQAAGGATLQVLARVAAAPDGLELLVVLCPDEGRPLRQPRAWERMLERFDRAGTHQALTLAPLSEADVLSLVQQVVSPDEPRRRLARALHERSAGHPARLVELLAGLESAGAVRHGPRGLELLVDPESLPLPESVARLFEDRLQALTTEQRLWLGRLAVFGAQLEPGALTRAFQPASRAEVVALLEGLEAEGWLECRGRSFGFRHGAERRAVLSRVSSERRARLHGKIAASLAERPGFDVAFRRAYHLHHAGRHAELLEVLPSLERHLVDEGHPRRVLPLCRWGLKALEATPETERPPGLEVSLMTAAVDAAHLAGDSEEEARLLDRLADLPLSVEDDPASVSRVYRRHGRHAAARGSFGMARGLLRNALGAAVTAGDAELEAQAALEFGHAQALVGELENARALARRAIECTRVPARRAKGLVLTSLLALLENRFTDALADASEALRALSEARGRDALEAAAQVWLMRSRAYRLLGKRRRAWVAVQHAEQLAVRSGHRRLEVEVAARRGRLLVETGYEREAELELREARLLARETGDAGGLVLPELFLGILLAERNDPEGETLLEQVRRETERLGLFRLEALATALCARVARARDDSASASERIEHATQLLRSYGAELQDRLVIQGTADLLARDAGRRDLARAIRRRTRAQLDWELDHTSPPSLRKSLERASRSVLEAASSPEGPVYPRSLLRDLPTLPSGA